MFEKIIDAPSIDSAVIRAFSPLLQNKNPPSLADHIYIAENGFVIDKGTGRIRKGHDIIAWPTAKMLKMTGLDRIYRLGDIGPDSRPREDNGTDEIGEDWPLPDSPN